MVFRPDCLIEAGVEAVLVGSLSLAFTSAALRGRPALLFPGTMVVAVSGEAGVDVTLVGSLSLAFTSAALRDRPVLLFSNRVQQ